MPKHRVNKFRGGSYVGEVKTNKIPISKAMWMDLDELAERVKAYDYDKDDLDKVLQHIHGEIKLVYVKGEAHCCGQASAVVRDDREGWMFKCVVCKTNE